MGARLLSTRLATGLLVLAPAWTGCSQEDAPRRPPNILLVIADDFGVDVFDAPEESPLHARTITLDRLRREGVTFTQTWANPVCSPTRATILTGRYSFRTGVGNAVKTGRPGLPLEELTIPEALDLAPALGYRHAAFGKWHVGSIEVGGADAPNLAGFGHFSGSLFGANPYKAKGDTNGYFHWSHVEDGRTTLRDGYRESNMVDDALAWLSGPDARYATGETGAIDRPWFCQVSFSLPHVPLHAPPAALHSVDLPETGPARTPLPYFRAMVEAMDRELGRLLAGLGAASGETVIVFVGDNGTDGVVVRAADERRGAQAKGMAFQGGIHVPLVVAGRGVSAGGRSCATLVNTTDLFATVLDLAGVPTPAIEAAARGPLDSVSLVPFLNDPAHPPVRDFAYAEAFSDDPGLYSFQTIRDGRHKLMRRFGIGPEAEWLFDLERDPGETNDLLDPAASPAPTNEDIAAVARLRARIEALIATKR